MKYRESGFIKFILIFLAIVVILSLFRVNLRGFIDEKITLTENFSLIWQMAKVIWQDYIVRPAKFIWFNYIRPILQGEIFSGLKNKLEKRNQIEQ